MAKYMALPLMMSDDFFHNRSDYGYGPVGEESDYVSRRALDVEADSPSWACEKVWMAYQNIDENRHCPDGGRSMMVGDLVKLADFDAPVPEVSLWQVATCGFKRVNFAPSEAKELV